MILTLAVWATLISDIVILTFLSVGWIRMCEGGKAQAYVHSIAGGLPLIMGGVLYAIAVFLGVGAAARASAGQQDALTTLYIGLYFALTLWCYSLVIPSLVRFLQKLAQEEARHDP